MPSMIIWLFLVWILCLATFGIFFCITVIMSCSFLILGFLMSLMVLCKSEKKKLPVPSAVPQYRKRYQTYKGIPKITYSVNHPEKQSKSDKRLTGSKKIDERLQEIIGFIIRDYIHTWYNDVSFNEEFVVHLKELFKCVLNNFSRSAIEVDWVSFFAKRLVDDFASHLRLYRQSEKALKKSLKEQSGKFENLEAAFFDFEVTMEKNVCRDNVCTLEDSEKKYLSGLSDMLLYLLLPPTDFKNPIFHHFLKEILCNSVLYSTVALLADPDFINQNLIWACKDYLLSSKAFVTVLRRTDSIDELMAVKEISKHEIKVHKSKDTSDKDEVKQYIKSISYVHDLANLRYQKLLNHNTEGETDSIDLSADVDWKSWVDSDVQDKLIVLPFDIVLNNNIGLHYFTEFMTTISAEGYAFFYHHIEGYRTTAETILSEVNDETTASALDYKMEKLRDYALQIFDMYLGETATLRAKFDEELLKNLHSRIKSERPTESFFDDVQAKVYKIMHNEFYATAFKASRYYVKLLAELDLLPDLSQKGDDNCFPVKLDDADKGEGASPASQQEDIVITELLGSEVPTSEFCFPETPLSQNLEEGKSEGLLTAEIYNTGITHHAGKTFAVYAIAVCHQRTEGPEEKWVVVRRYSEFHEFHKVVNTMFPCLSKIDFPSKKAFNNLSRHLMEKRRDALNNYLQFLLSTDVLESNEGLQIIIYNFLEPRVDAKEKKSLIRTVGTFVNPIRTSVRTVGSVMKIVPNTLFGLKDGLVKILNKGGNSQDPYCFEMDKVSAGLDFDADDIPLSIMLLLLDEVFDLKNKDQWFRRRIMILLRQIIKTTQGDAINKKVMDYAKGLTSASQLAEWLKIFSQTFWPNGMPAEPSEERERNIKLRTRIAAKALLICCIPDELKHVIGSETSYKGAMAIFGIFQHPALNRRLIYVLLESFLTALFPQNNIAEMIRKLHSKSPRTLPLVPLSNEHFGNQKADGVDSLNLTKKVPDTSTNQKTKTSKKDKNATHKRRSSLSCIGKQTSNGASPNPTRKRKKSLEAAIFYTIASENNLKPEATDPKPHR